MLSIFPTLLSYNMAVPLIFRLIGGFLFIYFGYSSIISFNRQTPDSPKPNSEKIWLWALAVIEILGGILLIAGFLTQISSLVLSIILILSLTSKYKSSINTLTLSSGFLFMLLIVIASLLLLGPGFYSIDLPV